MGPIWGRQDPGGPHVGPMDFVIWVYYSEFSGNSSTKELVGACKMKFMEWRCDEIRNMFMWLTYRLDLILPNFSDMFMCPHTQGWPQYHPKIAQLFSSCDWLKDELTNHCIDGDILSISHRGIKYVAKWSQSRSLRHPAGTAHWGWTHIVLLMFM